MTAALRNGYEQSTQFKQAFLVLSINRIVEGCHQWLGITHVFSTGTAPYQMTIPLWERRHIIDTEVFKRNLINIARWRANHAQREYITL